MLATSIAYPVQFRPKIENVTADALPSNVCALTNTFKLQGLRNNLCHSALRRLSHYVQSENLPFLIEHVKKTAPYVK